MLLAAGTVSCALNEALRLLKRNEEGTGIVATGQAEALLERRGLCLFLTVACKCSSLPSFPACSIDDRLPSPDRR